MEYELEEPPVDARFAEVDFLVESTDVEQQFLWETYHVELENKGIGWNSDNVGTFVVVGYIDIRNQKMPVCILFRWVRFGEKLVGFYEDTSNLVDHGMIKAWIDKFCSKQGRRKCDAGNFHLCLQFALKD